jgi:hypothetical protein
MDSRNDKRIPVYYIIQSHPVDGLAFAKARHQSLYGPVASGWEWADTRLQATVSQTASEKIGNLRRGNALLQLQHSGMGWFDSLVI